MLSDAEKRRYKRHIMLPEVGESGQEKLKSAKVMVIGAGGLGAPVLQYLAAAGVGTIAIMDDAIVDEDNLHCQVLYGGHDLGKLKTIISKQRLNALNPLVNIEIFNIRLKPENAVEFVSGYDIIVDATDNKMSGYLINDACIIAKKPWVFGSLDEYEGRVSTFNWLESPSLRCVFPEDHENNPEKTKMKGLLGILPGIIGLLQASEVIKIITGIGSPLIGKILVYNMLTHIVSSLAIKRNPENFKIITLRNTY